MEETLFPTSETIEGLITQACQNLLRAQRNLFQFTSQTNQTEWNLAHHLANELHAVFPDYDCDLEMTKPNLGNRRPDIVIHRRGSQDENLLVVEVKRSKELVASDVQKIRDYWLVPPLQYRFGAVVVIEENREPLVSVLANE